MKEFLEFYTGSGAINHANKKPSIISYHDELLRGIFCRLLCSVMLKSLDYYALYCIIVGNRQEKCIVNKKN
jgi:hypothetical protein